MNNSAKPSEIHEKPFQDAVRNPWVRHNDHSQLRIPPLGQWTPTLTVSILIPAHNHQDKLNLVLAALAAQTYPDHLTEVVIADDNSQPPLHLPDITPTHTRLITTPPTAWGSAHAVNTAAAHANGHILLRLDADMLTYHHHVESQLRYHHTLDYAAVIGHKLFTDHTPHQHTPTHIHHTVHQQQTHTLHNRDAAQGQWIENLIAATDSLRTAAFADAYRAFVGASGSVTRELFDEAGGLDSRLLLGGDTEFGYRLAQAGAVFIPDHDSSSWHLGRSQMQSRWDDGRRFRTPFIANRVPQFGARRKAPGRVWDTPLVDVVVQARDAHADDVETSVGELLGGDVVDIRVWLVGDWPDPDSRGGLDDSRLDSRLTRESFRADPRVHFVHDVPALDPSTPFRLLWPADSGARRDTIAKLTSTAERRQAGLVRVQLPEGRQARLERRAAFARARRLLGQDPEPEAVDHAVDEVCGVHDMRMSVSPPQRPPLFAHAPAGWARRLARRALPAETRRRLRRFLP